MNTYLVTNLGKPKEVNKKLIHADSEEEAAKLAGFDIMDVQHIFNGLTDKHLQLKEVSFE